jgi:hypothetical protein
MPINVHYRYQMDREEQTYGPDHEVLPLRYASDWCYKLSRHLATLFNRPGPRLITAVLIILLTRPLWQMHLCVIERVFQYDMHSNSDVDAGWLKSMLCQHTHRQIYSAASGLSM